MVKIIIVGAGVGGTAAAARLSKAGHEVVVYEKNSFIGGRCSLIHHGGYRFDQGPSLLLMLEIFEETFQDLGFNIKDMLELKQCNPNYQIFFDDGKVLEMSSNLPNLINEFRRFEPSSNLSSHLMEYLNEVEKHYSLGITHALKTNYNTVTDYLKWPLLRDFWKFHLFETVWDRTGKFFQSSYIRKAISFQTMYLGMSPYDAPGPYSLLPYTEIAGGIWYPVGGFAKVIEALQNIAEGFSAKFNFNTSIEKIAVNNDNEVTGVIINGKLENADLVICNADAVYAYNHLLPMTSYAKKLKMKSFTSSSISFYWSMKSKIAGLHVHNIFLGADYKESFDQIFKGFTLPDEPSFYVNIPSRIDETASPKGKDSLIILCPIGHLHPHKNPRDQIPNLVLKARSQIIKVLEKRLNISNFENLIEHEIINEPLSWEQKFNLWEGSALGLNHNWTQMLSFRPSLKCSNFKNLYFVGASVHPGTGVPVVLCGAKLLENQIQSDLQGRLKKSYAYINNILFLFFVMSLIILFFIY